jgi:hypothetical protein
MLKENAKHQQRTMCSASGWWLKKSATDDWQHNLHVRHKNTQEHAKHQARTMCSASGWWLKKSAMRQPSWMWLLGLGFRQCTMSGNFMPSRMKNTCSRKEVYTAKSTQHESSWCEVQAVHHVGELHAVADEEHLQQTGISNCEVTTS